ncbi:MAG: ferritin family protein [Sulfolobales archaeon]
MYEEMSRRHLEKMCRDEFEAHYIYKYLSKYLVSNENIKMIFKNASNDEWRHYLLLSEFVGDCSSKVSHLKALAFYIISLLFGVTITLKIMESMERSARESYSLLVKTDKSISDRIAELIKDEEIHERNLINNLNEKRIKYLSSIALGISDALVELTGIYAGALGALSSTVNAGLIGLLAGISAALSMTVASYTQAKQEVGKSPKLSALFTGIAYFAVVIALALPYFITSSILTAFISMLAIAIMLIAYISFYGAVLYDRNYLKEFIEGAFLLLGVSLLLYIIGENLRIAID